MSHQNSIDKPVVIIGGGLAGLATARELHQKNIQFRLFEASDRVGGRVKSDTLDGFILDRGFQVLITSYPENEHFLNTSALDLKSFLAGAYIHIGKKRYRIGDPFRDFLTIPRTLLSAIGLIRDKYLLLKLRNRLLKMSDAEIFKQPEISTLEALHNYGFSKTIIETLFKPFYGGIFLEPELKTSR